MTFKKQVTLQQNLDKTYALIGQTFIDYYPGKPIENKKKNCPEK